ncbi:MAG: serine/threonine protein kinase [Fusobacterium sp. JB021]|nr:serine/threonine protein kinase [Fusobacterium sp. JB021]
MMTNGIKEKIPLEVHRMKMIKTRDIPESLKYQEEYKFSLALQKKKAPVIFILSGTGSSATSIKTRYFERIFYTAGYHVVGISSIMNSNSVVSLSYNKMPGNLLADGFDLYRAIKNISSYIETRTKVESYSLMGYSLGGTHSAVLGFIDNKENYFDFKKIFVVNPSVNLYDSAELLDVMFDKLTNGNIEVLLRRVDELVDELSKNKERLDIKNPERAFTHLNIHRDDLKLGIGFIFRLTSVDINFLSDLLNKRKIYSNGEVSKYEDMTKYFKKINFANFEDYAQNIAYPYYKGLYGEKFTLKKVKEMSDLKSIDNYLKNAKNIYVVTNKDELILTNKNLKYLKRTFKNRLKVYPWGGHCGNMFYQENVDYMLKIMKEK